MKQLQPGDFVMMQFGHNDGGGLTGNRGRGSLKGNGDETQSITNSEGVVQAVHTYGWYLRQYIAGAKSKGATPIVISQIPRNIWKDGKVGRESSGYGKFAREAAEQGGARFLDLNELVAARYDKWTPRSGVDRQLFADLAAASGVPGSFKRMARERLAPRRRAVAIQTCLEEDGGRRFLSREELYELVWSEPLLTLSKRFGLSDNGLRKRCKSLNVPTPPRGYWERRRRGYKDSRAPLSRTGD